MGQHNFNFLVEGMMTSLMVVQVPSQDGKAPEFVILTPLSCKIDAATARELAKALVMAADQADQWAQAFGKESEDGDEE